MNQPITWDQIDDLVHQLKQVAAAAHKAAAALTRHQVKPFNRIHTLESQRNELNLAVTKAAKSLDQYTKQLRARQAQATDSNPSNHPGALPSGSSDQPIRNPNLPQ